MHVAGLRSSLVFLLQREYTVPHPHPPLHTALHLPETTKKKIAETKFTGRLALHHDDALEHCCKCVLDCSFTWNSADTQAPTFYRRFCTACPCAGDHPSTTTSTYEYEHELARAIEEQAEDTDTQCPRHLRLQVPELN